MSGKLTAEQVRKTVEKHWHDLPAEYDMPEATALPEYSYDWQAIADELNATLGVGECSIEWRDESYDTDAGYERDGAYFCTACKADLPYPLQECWDDYQAGNGEKPFDYCPNCGRRVVE